MSGRRTRMTQSEISQIPDVELAQRAQAGSLESFE